MPDSAITITGLEGALQDLDDIAEVFVEEALPKALAAAGEVIAGELLSRTPEAERQSTSAEANGRLRDGISTSIIIDPARLAGVVSVGFTGPLADTAIEVEYGHNQAAHDGRRVGFVPAHPFMRQASTSSENAAVDAFIENI